MLTSHKLKIIFFLFFALSFMLISGCGEKNKNNFTFSNKPIALRIEGPDGIEENTIQAYQAIVTQEDGTEKDVTDSVRWYIDSSDAVLGEPGQVLTATIDEAQSAILVASFDKTSSSNQNNSLKTKSSLSSPTSSALNSQKNILIAPKAHNDQGDRLIAFSGILWRVKSAKDSRVGPGPNYFSDDKKAVYKDENGNLVLRVWTDGSKWYSSEIYTYHKMSYGDYRVLIKRGVEDLPDEITFGFFTFDHQHKKVLTEEGYDWKEIDIEYIGNHYQYLLQPAPGAAGPGVEENWKRFEKGTMDLSDKGSTHGFLWYKNKVKFFTARGYYHNTLPEPEYSLIDPEHNRYSERKLMSFIYKEGQGNAVIPKPTSDTLHLNLYIANPVISPPKQEKEVVIKAVNLRPFRNEIVLDSFEGLKSCPINLNQPVKIQGEVLGKNEGTQYPLPNYQINVHDGLKQFTDSFATDSEGRFSYQTTASFLGTRWLQLSTNSSQKDLFFQVEEDSAPSPNTAIDNIAFYNKTTSDKELLIRLDSGNEYQEEYSINVSPGETVSAMSVLENSSVAFPCSGTNQQELQLHTGETVKCIVKNKGISDRTIVVPISLNTPLNYQGQVRGTDSLGLLKWFNQKEGLKFRGNAVFVLGKKDLVPPSQVKSSSYYSYSITVREATTTKPEINILSPQNNSKIQQQSFTVSGTSEGLAGKDITIHTSFKNQLNQHSVKVEPDGTWKTKVTIGSEVIYEEISGAIFAEYGTSVISNNITVIRTDISTPPKSISIDNPSDQSSVYQRKVLISGDSTGLAGETIQIKVKTDLLYSGDSVKVASDGTWAGYAYIGNDKIYEPVSATVYVEQGSIKSNSISITRTDVSQKTLTINNPSDNSSVYQRKVWVSGDSTGLAGEYIKVYINTDSTYYQGSTKVNSDGSWGKYVYIGQDVIYKEVQAEIFAKYPSTKSNTISVTRKDVTSVTKSITITFPKNYSSVYQQKVFIYGKATGFSGENLYIYVETDRAYYQGYAKVDSNGYWGMYVYVGPSSINSRITAKVYAIKSSTASNTLTIYRQP